VGPFFESANLRFDFGNPYLNRADSES